MRIMVDTNILISAFVFDSPVMTRLLTTIVKSHTLLVATCTTEEFLRVIRRKFPSSFFGAVEAFGSIPYETACTPTEIPPDIYGVRDSDDYPLLYTAILADAEMLVTGDKDLLSVQIERPVILSHLEFMAKFGE